MTRVEYFKLSTGHSQFLYVIFNLMACDVNRFVGNS